MDSAIVLKTSDDADQEDFEMQSGAYGAAWVLKYKDGDEDALPSVLEIVKGMVGWHKAQTYE